MKTPYTTIITVSLDDKNIGGAVEIRNQVEIYRDDVIVKHSWIVDTSLLTDGIIVNQGEYLADNAERILELVGIAARC